MEWPATRLPALLIQVRVSEALRPDWVVGVFFSEASVFPKLPPRCVERVAFPCASDLVLRLDHGIGREMLAASAPAWAEQELARSQ